MVSCVPVSDLNKYDPDRFHPPGLDFRGKLIGIEDVPDARGDKMCQVISGETCVRSSNRLACVVT